MDKYENLISEMKKKVKESHSSRYSKSDLTNVTRELLNTPEHDVPNFIEGKSGEAEKVITNPTKKYRNVLKNVVSQFGVDKNDADKLDNMSFSKEHAEAINEVAMTAQKGYLSTGRKLIYPIMSEGESQFEVLEVEVDEKVEDTRKPVEVSPGKYESVLTGERKHTKKHKRIKSSNKVPGWLTTKTKI